MSQVTLSFFGVQPIHIESDLYLELISKKINLQKLREISVPNSSKWLDRFIYNYDVYEDIYEIQLPNIEADLKKDFYRSFHPINNQHITLELSKYLTSNSVTLYFDPRFVYFILIYQINFEIPVEVLENFLDYKAHQDNDNNQDLYNTIRDVFVKDSKNHKMGAWGIEVQRKTLETIKHMLNEIYSVNILDKDVSIPVSSCNISNIVLAKEHINNNNFVKKLINLNIFAEKLTPNNEIVPLYNGTVYFSFHGRFHTIILKNESDLYRFQPLQFHIQYMWFLVERYNKIMSRINSNLMEADSRNNIQKYTSVIHTMINKIEFLRLHDMNFKHAIEIDIDIYEGNEKKWSISKLLDSAKEYVTFFKDYLERLFNQKNALFQKKLNFILVAISFMQLLALVSVWNDYLSTVNASNLNVDKRIIHIFGNDVSSLLNFNIYVPLVLLILMIGTSLYLWKSKRE